MPPLLFFLPYAKYGIISDILLNGVGLNEVCK